MREKAKDTNRDREGEKVENRGVHSCHDCMIITDSSVIEDLLTAFHYQQQTYYETERDREEEEDEEERKGERDSEREGEEALIGIRRRVVVVVIGVGGGYHRMAG